MRVDGTSRRLPVAAARVSDELPRSEAGRLKEGMHLCSLFIVSLCVRMTVCTKQFLSFSFEVLILYS